LYLNGAKCFFNGSLKSNISVIFVISFGVSSHFLENSTKNDLENLTFPLGNGRNFLLLLVSCPEKGARVGIHDEINGRW
jgi:hypothetical protein